MQAVTNVVNVQEQASTWPGVQSPAQSFLGTPAPQTSNAFGFPAQQFPSPSTNQKPAQPSQASMLQQRQQQLKMQQRQQQDQEWQKQQQLLMQQQQQQAERLQGEEQERQLRLRQEQYEQQRWGQSYIVLLWSCYHAPHKTLRLLRLSAGVLVSLSIGSCICLSCTAHLGTLQTICM